jgi:hypothetical protein
VLKSTGSAFENFVRDEFTTLPEVDDRIFSTSVDLRYTYGEVGVKLPPRAAHEDDQGPSVLKFGEETFDKSRTGVVYPWEDTEVGARARKTTLDVFAHDESASVQVRRMRGNEGCRLPITLFLWNRGLMKHRRRFTKWRSTYSPRTREWKVCDMCCRINTTSRWT